MDVLEKAYSIAGTLCAAALRAGVPESIIGWTASEQVFANIVEYLLDRDDKPLVLQELFVAVAADLDHSTVDGLTEVLRLIAAEFENPDDAAPETWPKLGGIAKERILATWSSLRACSSVSTSLSLSNLIARGLLEELAESFNDEISQWELLALAEFPKGNWPGEQTYSDAKGFWLHVCQAIADGKTKWGLRELLNGAAKLRPGNPAFRSF